MVQNTRIMIIYRKNTIVLKCIILLQDYKKFDSYTKNDIYFVNRLKDNAKFEEVEKLNTSENRYKKKKIQGEKHMKLLTFEYQGKQQVGVLSHSEKEIYPIKKLGVDYESMNAFIESVTKEEMSKLKVAVKKQEVEGIALDAVKVLAPIPNPKQDVICLGINYMAHAEESARYKKEAFGGERPFAVYFSKRVNEAVADGDSIPSYKGLVDSLDYEAELAVVIGKDAKNVSEEEAGDYVLGYTIINDVSARTLQTNHKQWYFGKSLDGFLPMGPYIATADEFAFPPVLKISSKVNDELRQNASTDLLIFGIPHIISELSQGMTLKAGTVIATGTPAGVGMGFQPPKFLKAGDKIECIIEGIGTLTNTVAD